MSALTYFIFMQKQVTQDTHCLDNANRMSSQRIRKGLNSTLEWIEIKILFPLPLLSLSLVLALWKMRSLSVTLIGVIRQTSYVYIVIEYRRSTGMRIVNRCVKMWDIAIRTRTDGDTLPDVSINTDYKFFLSARRDLHALHRVHCDTRCRLRAR